MAPSATSRAARLLGQRAALAVKLAEDKEPARAGTVYLAPPDYHLLVEVDETLSLSVDEPVCHCRPSIDVLFESAADAYGPDLVGVVLTGANHDGSAGLCAIKRRGGYAIVEDPTTAEARAMPAAAIEAAQEVVRLTGSRSTITHVPRPPDDPSVRRPDITRARTRLGWTPVVERSDGFARTIEWFRTTR